MAQQLDEWRRHQEDLPGRPEAIRRLVEIGLAVRSKQPLRAKSPERAFRARELAGKAIDEMGDPSVTAEERLERRRRLTRGPQEFRENRVDSPKSKK